MIQNRRELKGSRFWRVIPSRNLAPSLLPFFARVEVPAKSQRTCLAARYSDPLHPWLLIPAKINGRRNGSTESAEKVLASKVSDLGGRSLVRYGPAVDTGSCVRRGTCEAHSSRLGLLESQGL